MDLKQKGFFVLFFQMVIHLFRGFFFFFAASLTFLDYFFLSPIEPYAICQSVTERQTDVVALCSH